MFNEMFMEFRLADVDDNNQKFINIIIINIMNIDDVLDVHGV